MPRSDERLEPARDTIAAIATAPGRGGIGVVRVSGSRAGHVAATLLGCVPAPRRAVRCTARDGGARALDDGIALYFPAPASYTGEDVLEFQGHGGPVVMQSVLTACLDAGARLAQPGEFTQRAFLNGKLDLAQAEAVADLIDAASREAARSAMRSLKGEFSVAVDTLIRELTDLRALTEAMLDFPEEDVDALHRNTARVRLESALSGLECVLAESRQGSLLRNGINLVLAGRPNVGKSSLLNRLAGEERALVTAIPGTTRDALRETVQIEGVPLNVVDTAGLREAQDEIERLGIERSRYELARADIVVAVLEADRGLGDDDRALLAELPTTVGRLHVFNKCDLTPAVAPGLRGGEPPEVWVSAKTGAGLDALHRALLQAAGWVGSGEPVFLARERHVRALLKARSHLAEARDAAQWELFAEELRLAQDALTEIGGSFTPDDLLGEIFSRFCIGK